MLEDVLRYLEEKRSCPHCGQTLSLCHAPSIHVGDGLGWGSEYLFICLNDECPMFAGGWDFIAQQYGHVGSYRYMELPGSRENHAMMVAGKDAFTGSIVDVDELRRQDQRYQKLQEALSQLDTCVAERNLVPVLTVLLDDAARLDERKRAASLLAELNDLDCVEPVRNHSFRDGSLQLQVNMALKAVLEHHYLKECPYCAELIKARARVCKHCKHELAA
ncbi:zinc ribbon domain-containing protein [Desulfobulbus oralis]|uniref:Zinc ribbon domain-containing protein n=2 Tax=Desulfobulbus oralis TaxID=1986146 RepID=A0A2L1GRK1_9BACT|nr:zinc ribbon domain-containing protein [Desulfobulbus oralis]